MLIHRIIALSFRKKLIVSGAVVALAAGGVTAALNQPATTGADTSPIVQQVNHNTDELANHEGRITNTENDVKDLQNKTGTPPSSTRIVVQAVTTPAASSPVTDPTPAPTSPPSGPVAVTVAGSGLIVGGQYDGYCLLTYTDGSKDYAKATLTTTHDGNNSSTSDNCNSFVGQAK